MSNNTTANSKKTPFSFKKIPSKFSSLLLTSGASLILGFLSFSGMYALLPVLSLAIAAFILSVAYEGEIYLQNINGALNKLFKNDYLKNYLAREYLLNHFPDTTDDQCPQFFRDYKAQLELLASFNHKKLDESSLKRKKRIEKTLKDMEQWFAQQLFPSKKDAFLESDYSRKLQLWLAQHYQDEQQEQIKKRRNHFKLVKGFSLLAGLFMGLGSTYLIVEAFSVIPLLAAIPFAFWPIIIVPMALIAGIAYGLLTYNAITDMINNNTILKWYQKLRDDLSKGVNVRNVLMTITAGLLAVLAIGLTICTAGTWWTVATNARPLFEWMTNMPKFIMGVINPVITGLSAIFFNIQNTAESLEMVDQATRSKNNLFQSFYESLVKGWEHLRKTENWFQIFNPFRLLIKLTITPLRVLLFLGHLLSIAFTSDRMPGVPQIISLLLAIIAEGFEDAHYFWELNHSHDHDHEHEHCHEEGEEHQHDHFKELLKERLGSESGHNHSTDIPTWILNTLATPLYALAALWDYSFSTLNHSPSDIETPFSSPSEHMHIPKQLTFKEAWDKQRGIPHENHVEIEQNAPLPSKEWQVEHAVAQISKFQEKHLKEVTFGQDLADEKVIELDRLKEKIRKPKPGDTLAETLQQAKNQPIYNKHRMFAQEGEDTTTQRFIEELPQRVNLMSGG
jgi:hypothetical protein